MAGIFDGGSNSYVAARRKQLEYAPSLDAQYRRDEGAKDFGQSQSEFMGLLAGLKNAGFLQMAPSSAYGSADGNGAGAMAPRIGSWAPSGGAIPITAVGPWNR